MKELLEKARAKQKQPRMGDFPNPPRFYYIIKGPNGWMNYPHTVDNPKDADRFGSLSDTAAYLKDRDLKGTFIVEVIIRIP